MKKILFYIGIALFALQSCGGSDSDNSQTINEDSLQQEIKKTEEDIQKIDKTTKELDTASVKLDEALKEIQ